jgi:hypothetical protein
MPALEAPAAAPAAAAAAPACCAAAAADAPLQPPPALACWYDDTRALMVACYGEAAFARLAAALMQPPGATCVRVNTLAPGSDTVHATLEALVGGGVTQAHAGMPEALLVPGSGLHHVDVSLAAGRELAVNRRCAEAVLRGADVYVPGVLGCTAGVEEGMLVAVTAVVEPLGATSAGMTRGTVLPPLAGAPTRMLLGCARACAA